MRLLASLTASAIACIVGLASAGPPAPPDADCDEKARDAPGAGANQDADADAEGEVTQRQRPGSTLAPERAVVPVPLRAMIGRLDLSDRQRQQFRQMLADHDERLQQRRREIVELRKQAAAARREGDTEKAEAISDRLRRLIDRGYEAEEQILLQQARQMLTPRQNRQLDRALAERERFFRRQHPLGGSRLQPPEQRAREQQERIEQQRQRRERIEQRRRELQQRRSSQPDEEATPPEPAEPPAEPDDDESPDRRPGT